MTCSLVAHNPPPQVKLQVCPCQSFLLREFKGFAGTFLGNLRDLLGHLREFKGIPWATLRELKVIQG